LKVSLKVFGRAKLEFTCHNISNCIENDCFAEPAPFSPYRQKCSSRLKMPIELMVNIRVVFFYITPPTNPVLHKLLITNKQER
jgi:hypothetical protein